MGKTTLIAEQPDHIDIIELSSEWNVLKQRMFLDQPDLGNPLSSGYGFQ
jgi:hypothetical protein